MLLEEAHSACSSISVCSWQKSGVLVDVHYASEVAARMLFKHYAYQCKHDKSSFMKTEALKNQMPGKESMKVKMLKIIFMDVWEINKHWKENYNNI